MFERFRRWLRGEFTCIRCGKKWYSINFGYGAMICPECYNGEKIWLFPDMTYWLNRLVYKKRDGICNV